MGAASSAPTWDALLAGRVGSAPTWDALLDGRGELGPHVRRAAGGDSMGAASSAPRGTRCSPGASTRPPRGTRCSPGASTRPPRGTRCSMGAASSAPTWDAQREVRGELGSHVGRVARRARRLGPHVGRAAGGDSRGWDGFDRIVQNALAHTQYLCLGASYHSRSRPPPARPLTLAAARPTPEHARAHGAGRPSSRGETRLARRSVGSIERQRAAKRRGLGSERGSFHRWLFEGRPG